MTFAEELKSFKQTHRYSESYACYAAGFDGHVATLYKVEEYVNATKQFLKNDSE